MSSSSNELIHAFVVKLWHLHTKLYKFGQNVVLDISHMKYQRPFKIIRASDISRKKSKISQDFQGQIRGKIGRFRGIFAGKKVKFRGTIGRFRAIFAGEKSKFAEKSAHFAGF